MLNPNQYILTDRSITYGLHQFKDGKPILCQQHSSGDWVTVRPALPSEVEYFKAHGKRPEVKG
jgi:hypothetical protein